RSFWPGPQRENNNRKLYYADAGNDPVAQRSCPATGAHQIFYKGHGPVAFETIHLSRAYPCGIGSAEQTPPPHTAGWVAKAPWPDLGVSAKKRVDPGLHKSSAQYRGHGTPLSNLAE